MKACFKCHELLPRSEFYAHPMMGDGLLGKCKTCARRDVREHYMVRRTDPSYVEAERRRGREKHHRLYSTGRNWTSPEADDATKQRARNALSNAVRDGRVAKPASCSDCGAGGRIHGHHTDYAKPLAVEWLCSTCHRRRHATVPERVKPSVGRVA